MHRAKNAGCVGDGAVEVVGVKIPEDGTELQEVAFRAYGGGEAGCLGGEIVGVVVGCCRFVGPR